MNFGSSVKACVGDYSALTIGEFKYNRKDKTGSGDVVANVTLVEGSVFDIDGISVHPKSASLELSGKLTSKGNSINFVQSTTAVSQLTLQNVDVKSDDDWKSTLTAGTVGISGLTLKRHEDDKVDSSVALSVDASAAFELEKNGLTIKVPAFELDDFQLQSVEANGKSHFEIATSSPTKLENVSIGYAASGSQLGVTVPKFQFEGIAKTELHNVGINLNSLFGEATSLEFRAKDGTQVKASLAKGFNVEAEDGQLVMQGVDKDDFQLGKVTGKGTVSTMQVAPKGRSPITLKNLNLDLTADCREDIKVSGKLNGSASLPPKLIGIRNAQINAPTLDIGLDSDGTLKSGNIELVVTVPKSELIALIKSKIPAEEAIGNIRIFEKRFRIKPIVDETIHWTYRDVKVQTKNPKIDLVDGRFVVKAKPRVKGDLKNFGETSATFDVTGSIGVDFSEPYELAGLKILGNATYQRAEVRVGSSLARRYFGVAFDITSKFVNKLMEAPLIRHLPKKFEFVLFDQNQLSSNELLRRIKTPRVSFNQQGNNAVLRISGTVGE